MRLQIDRVDGHDAAAFLEDKALHAVFVAPLYIIRTAQHFELMCACKGAADINECSLTDLPTLRHRCFVNSMPSCLLIRENRVALSATASP